MTDDFNSAAGHFISAKVSKKEKKKETKARNVIKDFHSISVSGSALTCILDWISDLNSVVLL